MSMHCILGTVHVYNRHSMTSKYPLPSPQVDVFSFGVNVFEVRHNSLSLAAAWSLAYAHVAMLGRRDKAWTIVLDAL